MTASVVNASATPITWSGGGGPTTPAIPTDTASGMLLLLPVCARATGVDINDTATYSRLSADDVDQGTMAVGEIQGKIAGSSESAPSVTSTIVDTQPTGAFLLAVTDWSGDLGDIFVATPNLGTSQNVPAPDATALVDDTLVIRVYMQADDNTVVTPPAGHTQKFFQLSIQGSDMNMSAYVKDAAINSGGTAGVATLVMSGSDPYLAWTILVPPLETGGEVTLTVADTSQGQTTDNAELTQAHVLSGVADTEQAQTLDTATLAQTHVLEAESTAQGQTAGSPALTQEHTLAVQDAAQEQHSESPSLNTGTTLVVANAIHGQTSDSPALTQDQFLVVQGTEQEQFADRPVLIQAHNLLVQDTAQAQHADVVTLTEGDITTPTERSIIVVEESRHVIVGPEQRVISVEAETRVVTVTR